MVQPVNERVDRSRWPYRMKDLCARTGLGRQAIHFYIREGLVPPGHKTGRNMAFYGSEHLTRLELIQQLQHERFLPLKAIKAMLNEEEESTREGQGHIPGPLPSALKTQSMCGGGHRCYLGVRGCSDLPDPEPRNTAKRN